MPLPDFIIIGVQKCGTTKLTRCLNRHPDIFMGRRPRRGDEIHFFDREWNQGIKWYKERFRDGMVNGEKTPSYLTRTDAAIRMHAVVPDAKLIVLLRDPVLRYFSGHRHHLYLAGRAKRDEKHMFLYPFHKSTAGADARWRGCYYTQFQHLFTLYPREQVHIIFTSEMRKDTEATVKQTLEFIGVLPCKVVNNHPSVEKRVPNERLAKIMIDYYKPMNRALYDLLHQPAPMLEWLGM